MTNDEIRMTNAPLPRLCRKAEKIRRQNQRISSKNSDSGCISYSAHLLSSFRSFPRSAWERACRSSASTYSMCGRGAPVCGKAFAERGALLEAGVPFSTGSNQMVYVGSAGKRRTQLFVALCRGSPDAQPFVTRVPHATGHLFVYGRYDAERRYARSHAERGNEILPFFSVIRRYYVRVS
jgi:hypothetical protein